MKIVAENIKDLFQINLCASRRLKDFILKYIFNKYIYGRNILMQRRFSKIYIFPLEDFLELKHCEAYIKKVAKAILFTKTEA